MVEHGKVKGDTLHFYCILPNATIFRRSKNDQTGYLYNEYLTKPAMVPEAIDSFP